jgi:hypothetical protein
MYLALDLGCSILLTGETHHSSLPLLPFVCQSSYTMSELGRNKAVNMKVPLYSLPCNPALSVGK